MYFDTSAVLPYYRTEANSASIQNLLMSLETPALVSDLTRVEFASALSRWVRMHEIVEGDAELIGRAFDEDVAMGRFKLCTNTPRQYSLARQWLLARKTSLRTLDALHLACAAHEGATLDRKS